jgi:thioesterase domain-containing protein
MNAKVEFERTLLRDIPLARAMQVRVVDYDGERLTLAAPLPPNVNDKGCAFGGSLASLLILAGWGLLVLKRGTDDCDIYVQDSTIRYLAPVWTELRAEARLAAEESWDAFAAALADRGRGRIAIQARVPDPQGGDACVLTARFVARCRGDGPPAAQ